MGQPGLIGVLLMVVVTTTMLSLGMSLSARDILSSSRRTSLLIRAAVAAYVAAVAWTWIVVQALAVPVASAGALLLLMCIPPAATATKCAAIAKADQAFALTVLVILSMVAIVATPFLLGLVLPVQGPVELDRAQIIRTLLLLVIVPATAGILTRTLAPALAIRLKGPAMTVSNAALAVVLAAVMWKYHWAIIKLGPATLAAIVLVFAGSMAAGWLLSGPARATRFAGATACSARNAGIALLIVATNFPVSRIGDENTARVIATVVAYALFELTAGYVLAVYHGRRTRGTTNGGAVRTS